MPDTLTDRFEPIDGLIVELSDGVLSLTINRPDSLNSLNARVLEAMATTLERAANDVRVRVVRLGGAGRGFSSGAAVGADVDEAGYEPEDTLLQANRAVRAIIDLPRPVVAVVHGPAAGVGVSLALACDLVLASETAFFLLAFTKIGLMPDGGATALVAANVGRNRALKMALLADRLSAAEALQWGLVSTVYPAETLVSNAEELLARLARGPSNAYAKTKAAINGATLSEFDRVLERENSGQRILMNAHDMREGSAAFREKRAPVFSDT